MSDSVRPHRRQPARLPRAWDSPGKNTGVGCRFLLQCMKVKSESEVTQLCPTLHNPMDCSPPGSSVHGIFQARVLEWGAIAFSILLARVEQKKKKWHFISTHGWLRQTLWTPKNYIEVKSLENTSWNCSELRGTNRILFLAFSHHPSLNPTLLVVNCIYLHI